MCWNGTRSKTLPVVVLELPPSHDEHLAPLCSNCSLIFQLPTETAGGGERDPDEIGQLAATDRQVQQDPSRRPFSEPPTEGEEGVGEPLPSVFEEKVRKLPLRMRQPLGGVGREGHGKVRCSLDQTRQVTPVEEAYLTCLQGRGLCRPGPVATDRLDSEEVSGSQDLKDLPIALRIADAALQQAGPDAVNALGHLPFTQHDLPLGESP